MSAILSHPRIQELRKQRQELSLRLGEYLEEWRTIQEVTNPAILANYDYYFRSLEVEIQRKTFEEKELGRREELFRLKLERGEKLTPQIIDLLNKVVDKEFARLRQRIAEALDMDANERNRIRKERLASEEEEQISQIYRTVVKKLHPDAAGEQSESYAKFWSIAQEAYQSRNIQRLRSIREIVYAATEEQFSDIDSAEESLSKEVQRLQERIRTEERKLRELKAAEPFALKDMLQDLHWLEEHEKELEDQIAALDRKIARHNEFLSSLLGEDWKDRKISKEEEEAKQFTNEFVNNTYFDAR